MNAGSLKVSGTAILDQNVFYFTMIMLPQAVQNRLKFAFRLPQAVQSRLKFAFRLHEMPDYHNGLSH